MQTNNNPNHIKMNNDTAFDQFIREKACMARPRIGIGIIHPDENIIDSLHQAKKFCDVVVFGHRIQDMECNTAGSPEKSLIMALKAGEIDAVVRGQASATVLRSLIVEKLNYKPEDIRDLAMVKDNFGHVFVLSPVAHTQGWTVSQKIELINDAVELLTLVKLPVKVGITSGARPEELRKDMPMLYQTYDDAEEIVSTTGGKMNVKHYYVDIQKAICDQCTLLIAVNGMVGNHVLRALTFLGGIKIYGGIIAGIKELVVESFRNAPGFYEYLEFTSALANLRTC